MKKNKLFILIFILIVSIFSVFIAYIILNYKKNNNYETRYYQYFEDYGLSNDGSIYEYYSSEIELNADKTARWRSGGTNAGGLAYYGTYVEDSTSIILNLILGLDSNSICDSNYYMCDITLTLNKISKNNIKSIDEPGNLSREYKLVDK